MNVFEDFAKEIEGKRILITGGTGSFGHFIVNELLKYSPKEITVFSRDEDKQYRMQMGILSPYVSTSHLPEEVMIFERAKDKTLKFMIGDIRDLNRVIEATRNIDIIYNAAALKQVPYCEFHPFEAVKTNVIGAYNVKYAAIANNVGKVISISTDKAVKPVNAMGISKSLQEKVLIATEDLDFDTKICCVRYGNVIGSRGSVIPLFADRIAKKSPLPITHPDMTRFLITLKEAIGLVFYATMQMEGGEIFVKKLPSCRIADLAQVMGKHLGGRDNYPIDVIGIRPGEKIHECLVSEEEMARSEDNEGGFYIIHPHERGFESQVKRYDYTSANTTILDKFGIADLLRQTGWIKH